jgi:hypothetical protein
LWTHKINQEMETFYFDDLRVTGLSELELFKVVRSSHWAISIMLQTCSHLFYCSYDYYI